MYVKCSVTFIPGEFHLHLEEYRGIAILFTCNYVGSAPTDLPETQNDFEEMEKTFQELKYKVYSKRNMDLKRSDIVSLLDALREYLESYDGKPLTNQDGSPKVIAFAFSGHGTKHPSHEDSVLLTFDNQQLFLKKDIMGRIGVKQVKAIPKLYFIDACRGSLQLDDTKGEEDEEKGNVNVEGNFRIDFATIPNHVAFGTSGKSRWMPVLADTLRKEKVESLQNIAAIASKKVNDDYNEKKPVEKQQICESCDHLLTGPLYLHPDRWNQVVANT